MIRLFAAVPLPEDVAEELSQLQSGIADARWRPEDALHITLRFFGDIPEDRAEDVDAELSCIAPRPFQLALSGVGSFGEGHRINAVWAGVEPNDALSHLAARCETAARRAGLKPETRKYLPHVTLAYLTYPSPVEVAAWVQAHNLFKSGPFAVTDFRLYSSRLLAGGSRYEVQRVYRF